MAALPTLFLDRDGVLNIRPAGDYVRAPEAFIPSEGTTEAMRRLAGLFGRIIVVTNQAGIGKGLMTETDLASIHRKMQTIIFSEGGRIDRIYHCPHTKEANCRCRKPATGMAWLALADFPDIDFEDAWIVGDSVSDMQFGQSLGMRTVLIHGKTEEADSLAAMRLDFRFDSLLHFARYVTGC